MAATRHEAALQGRLQSKGLDAGSTTCATSSFPKGIGADQNQDL